MAVPIALEGSKQLGHFVFGQMLTDAVHFVGIARPGTDRIN